MTQGTSCIQRGLLLLEDLILSPLAAFWIVDSALAGQFAEPSSAYYGTCGYPSEMTRFQEEKCSGATFGSSICTRNSRSGGPWEIMKSWRGERNDRRSILADRMSQPLRW
ncbi:hypothetical protein BGZ63DRAFT_241419 [Mariannaea sp. PMI_226]|nr:hypothetical protein BGZ63DRAFT_241419 [Mariannaea sp. PMI_226]